MPPRKVLKIVLRMEMRSATPALARTGARTRTRARQIAMTPREFLLHHCQFLIAFKTFFIAPPLSALRPVPPPAMDRHRQDRRDRSRPAPRRPEALVPASAAPTNTRDSRVLVDRWSCSSNQSAWA